MFRARWRNVFGPSLAVVGTVALLIVTATQLVSAAPLNLGPSAGGSPQCLPGAGFVAAAASRAAGAPPPAVRSRVDERGVFIGREIAFTARQREIGLLLPPESFVGSPIGDEFVYTEATGGHSEVHAVELSSGCDALVVRPTGIVRSAVLDPTGSSVYVHTVTNPDRNDAGVARYAVDGSGSELVVPPLPNDAAFGPTFGTQLGWSTDSAALFVQSCGIEACRTRLLDVPTRSISTFDGPGQGSVIAVTPKHVVTFGDCTGLPCSVLAIDRSSRATTTLADDAWSTSIAVARDGAGTVRIETAAGIVEVTQ